VGYGISGSRLGQEAVAGAILAEDDDSVADGQKPGTVPL
jgi:hypothetical protein